MLSALSPKILYTESQRITGLPEAEVLVSDDMSVFVPQECCTTSKAGS